MHPASPTTPLASDDPVLRVVDLCNLAAGALRRYAREHDAAADYRSTFGRANWQHDACLATSRGEAAGALEALMAALDEGDRRCIAGEQIAYLRRSSAIPSATLTAMADGWDAYAAMLATPPHVEAGQAALAERGSLGAVLAADALCCLRCGMRKPCPCAVETFGC